MQEYVQMQRSLPVRSMLVGLLDNGCKRCTSVGLEQTICARPKALPSDNLRCRDHQSANGFSMRYIPCSVYDMNTGFDEAFEVQYATSFGHAP